MDHSPRTAIVTFSWRSLSFRRDRRSGASRTCGRRSTGTSSASAQKGEDLPEKSSRLFEVVCKGCGGTLVTVERLRDSEISGSNLAVHARRQAGDVRNFRVDLTATKKVGYSSRTLYS